MHKAQSQVRQFHLKVVRAPASPAPPALRDPELRARLIAEEAAETVAALVGSEHAGRILAEYAAGAAASGQKPDLVEAVDGLCDLIYVGYGTAEAVGVDLEPYFDAVHESNMAKTGEAVDEHGKKGRKPPGWEPPTAAVARLLASAFAGAGPDLWAARLAAQRAQTQVDLAGAPPDAWMRLHLAMSHVDQARPDPAQAEKCRRACLKNLAEAADGDGSAGKTLAALVEAAARKLGEDCLEAKASVVFVFDAEKRLLLARGPSWSLPGGKREPGETAAEAAARELGEETGLKTSGWPLHFVGAAPIAGDPGSLMAVYVASNAEFKTLEWEVAEGACRMTSFREAFEIYREDWRKAFRAAAALVRRAAAAEPARPEGPHEFLRGLEDLGFSSAAARLRREALERAALALGDAP